MQRFCRNWPLRYHVRPMIGAASFGAMGEGVAYLASPSRSKYHVAKPLILKGFSSQYNAMCGRLFFAIRFFQVSRVTCSKNL